VLNENFIKGNILKQNKKIFLPLKEEKITDDISKGLDLEIQVKKKRKCKEVKTDC